MLPELRPCCGANGSSRICSILRLHLLRRTVPPLDESPVSGRKLTTREKVERHRSNPACAGCHARIDALGFALENFDVIGRWRARDEGGEIDPSGKLPNGVSFSGPRGLKKLLLEDSERVCSRDGGEADDLRAGPRIGCAGSTRGARDHAKHRSQPVPFLGSDRCYRKKCPLPDETDAGALKVMFVTQKSLPRRTILRGAGTALALPLLDAMVPALKAERLTAAAPVRRLGFVMYPLGVDQDRWRPKGEGADYQFSEALAPLAPHRKKFVVISGLSSDPDRSKPGFHDRALASFMTGVEPTKGKIHVGISIDQLAAQTLGKETQFASLELAAEKTTVGSAHVGPIFKSATVPLPLEYNPRRVFEQLFGEGGRIDPEAQRPRGKRPIAAASTPSPSASRN